MDAPQTVVTKSQLHRASLRWHTGSAEDDPEREPVSARFRSPRGRNRRAVAPTQPARLELQTHRSDAGRRAYFVALPAFPPPAPEAPPEAGTPPKPPLCKAAAGVIDPDAPALPPDADAGEEPVGLVAAALEGAASSGAAPLATPMEAGARREPGWRGASPGRGGRTATAVGEGAPWGRSVRATL
jgi:hypothetical protein